MYEEVLKEQLFDKIEDNSTVAIFGACTAGERILDDIKKYKNNVNVVCFIDNFVKGTFANLPVYNLKEFIDKNFNCDLVIMSTYNHTYFMINILRLYDYNVLEQTSFMYRYYRFANETFEKALNAFEKQEDRNLYKLLFNTRLGLKDKSLIAKYFNAEFPSSLNFSIISKQYLDKINQNAVKTVFDIGFNNGLNAVAYNKFLPNLENIYGFEAIYDVCANEAIEPLIKNDKLKIVQKCIGSEKGTASFVINNDSFSSSVCADFTTKNYSHITNPTEITVDVIKLDDYCDENNVYPGLIKMDIEGAEMSALKGAINAIKKSRPQLAISIYHSNKDFVEIPVYLKENLENYTFKLGHYRADLTETILYAIPDELILSK